MIIHVASLRPAKIDAVRQAAGTIASIDARFGNVEVRPRRVTTNAPDMPMTQQAIIEGARARAAALMNGRGIPEHSDEGDRDFFVGLEGGLDPLPSAGGELQYTLQSWACVTDGVRWSYGAGGSLLVPAGIARDVVAGQELGDVIDRLAGEPVRGTRGAWGVLTRDLIGRGDMFKVAVVSAFAPFFNRTYYG